MARLKDQLFPPIVESSFKLSGLYADEQRKKRTIDESHAVLGMMSIALFFCCLAKDSITDTRKHIPDQHWWLGEGDDIL